MLDRHSAIESGLSRYFTGKPCPQGHVADRMVSTRACTQCLAEKTATWRAANPDKVNAQKRAWVAANPEKAKALKSAEQKRNRASANERQRRYREANRDRTVAASKAWAEANPAKCAAKFARYNAAKLQRTPPWADHFAIDGMYELAQLFRGVGLQIEVDHVVPLQGRAVSGLHVADNLQLISALANKAKSNRFATA